MLISSNFENVKTIDLSKAEQAAAARYIAAYKQKLVSKGFAAAAVNLLQIEIKQCTLNLTGLEILTGMEHPMADGRPFYAISVTSPGSMVQAAQTKSQSPLKASIIDQAALLAYETGVNILPKAAEVAEHYASGKNGGVTHSPFEGMSEIYTRADLESFFTLAVMAASARMKAVLDAGKPKAEGSKPERRNGLQF